MAPGGRDDTGRPRPPKRRLAAFAAILTCLSPASAEPPRPDLELRLASISYRLSAAGASLCARPQPITGMLLHELGQYDRADRAGVAQTFDLHDGIGVRGVVDGSTAAQAGIRSRDEIVAIDGRPIRAFLPPDDGRKGSYDRMAAFDRALASSLASGPATLALRRGSTALAVTLASVRACGGEAVLTPSTALNAWSDGDYVVVTTRLAEFADDDEALAFVVAHEMAHNILQHARGSLAGNGLFAGTAAHRLGVKAQEAEADRYAVRILMQAGYGLEGGRGFLARSGKARWMDLPFTHPGIHRRMEIMAAAEQEWASRLATPAG